MTFQDFPRSESALFSGGEEGSSGNCLRVFCCTGSVDGVWFIWKAILSDFL